MLLRTVISRASLSGSAGSDGNFVAARGVPVLDGMGAVGGHPHARGEYIELSASLERVWIAADVLGAVRAGGT